MFKQTILALGAMLALAACNQPAAPPAAETEAVSQSEPASEVVVFEFIDPASEEHFRAQTNDAAVIARARAELAKPVAERGLHFHGQLTRGDGVNAPWSFGFGQWDLVEVSIKACDGSPSDVEQNLDQWMRTGWLCPWTSRVESEIAG